MCLEQIEPWDRSVTSHSHLNTPGKRMPSPYIYTGTIIDNVTYIEGVGP